MNRPLVFIAGAFDFSSTDNILLNRTAHGLILQPQIILSHPDKVLLPGQQAIQQVMASSNIPLLQ